MSKIPRANTLQKIQPMALPTINPSPRERASLIHQQPTRHLPTHHAECVLFSRMQSPNPSSPSQNTRDQPLDDLLYSTTPAPTNTIIPFSISKSTAATRTSGPPPDIKPSFPCHPDFPYPGWGGAARWYAPHAHRVLRGRTCTWCFNDYVAALPCTELAEYLGIWRWSRCTDCIGFGKCLRNGTFFHCTDDA